MTVKELKDESLANYHPNYTPPSKYVDWEQGGINFLALLEDIRGEKSKFKLNHFGIESFFLPSPEKSVEYIYGMTFKQMFKMIEVSSGNTLPISRSSWFELFKGGVAYPTAKKLLNWLMLSYSDFLSRTNLFTRKLIVRGISEASVAGQWLSFIAGIKASRAYQEPDVSKEYEVLMDFVIRRCDAESAMRSEIRGFINNGKLDKNDAIGILKLMQPYLYQSTLIPKSELDAFENVIVLYRGENKISETNIVEFTRAYCFIQHDFYLNLFASYEVGCVLAYQDDKSDLTERKGLMCRAITKRALNAVDASGKNTFFGELLEEIRDVISKNIKELGFREMARHIPLNTDASNPSAESESDRCYNTFKAWRAGKEVPSFERLDKFLFNLCESIGQDIHAQLLIMCNMVIGLDKLQRNWEQLLSSVSEIKNKEPLYNIFPEVISRYETYYEHHLQLQLNKK